MDFQLKKVKVHDDMSEETMCFSAELWENGKHVANVSNRGHGGCNDVYPIPPLKYRDIEKYTSLDAECDIMTMAYDIHITKKYQSKKFVLKKGDDYSFYDVKPSIAMKKKMQYYDSWLANMKTQIERHGYKILNTNL